MRKIARSKQHVLITLNAEANLVILSFRFTFHHQNKKL